MGSRTEYMKLKSRERRKNPEHIRKVRSIQLFRAYGITIEEYDAMSEKQGHVCAICGNAETAMIRDTVKKLAVDHCHQSGKVRGLLCADCNRALGMFKDNIDSLEAAINYLKEASRGN